MYVIMRHCHRIGIAKARVIAPFAACRRIKVGVVLIPHDAISDPDDHYTD